MAITTEITTIQPANELPAGYTPPSTTINLGSTPVEKKFQATIATSGVAHASNASTGVTQLLSAVKTYIDGTLIPNTLKLNSSATVNGIIYVEKVRVTNTRANIYRTGTENYVVIGTFKYV